MLTVRWTIGAVREETRSCLIAATESLAAQGCHLLNLHQPGMVIQLLP